MGGPIQVAVSTRVLTFEWHVLPPFFTLRHRLNRLTSSLLSPALAFNAAKEIPLWVSRSITSQYICVLCVVRQYPIHQEHLHCLFQNRADVYGVHVHHFHCLYVQSRCMLRYTHAYRATGVGIKIWISFRHSQALEEQTLYPQVLMFHGADRATLLVICRDGFDTSACHDNRI
jgi:hypothetical protein